MDLSLNADAALRAYLPPESWNGEAQHRFVFRTEEGDEEPLLARLAVVQPDVNNNRFQHCVVLRPENAEGTRIFIAENLYYCEKRKKIEAWMTPRAAGRFNWSLFEQCFNDNRYTRQLSRFWLAREGKRNVVLRIGADGWGEVLGFEEEETKHTFYAEPFIWQHDYYTPHDQRDLRFLRRKNANFRRQIRSRWQNPEGEIRATLRWQLLSPEERESVAFHCQQGEWNELQSIAAMALRVRLSRLKILPSNVCEWDFTAYGEIWVSGADLHNDDFLFDWRAAIVQVFQPDNVDATGKMIEARPLCMWSYVGDSGLGLVRVEPFSQHELTESHLKLRQWAQEHFPLEEAERLLAL